jgi:hypothetical protein
MTRHGANWITALERLLVELGLIAAEGLVARSPATVGIGPTAEA